MLRSIGLTKLTLFLVTRNFGLSFLKKLVLAALVLRCEICQVLAQTTSPSPNESSLLFSAPLTSIPTSVLTVLSTGVPTAVSSFPSFVPAPAANDTSNPSTTPSFVSLLPSQPPSHIPSSIPSIVPTHVPTISPTWSIKDGYEEKMSIELVGMSDIGGNGPQQTFEIIINNHIQDWSSQNDKLRNFLEVKTRYAYAEVKPVMDGSTSNITVPVLTVFYTQSFTYRPQDSSKISSVVLTDPFTEKSDSNGFISKLKGNLAHGSNFSDLKNVTNVKVNVFETEDVYDVSGLSIQLYPMRKMIEAFNLADFTSAMEEFLEKFYQEKYINKATNVLVDSTDNNDGVDVTTCLVVGQELEGDQLTVRYLVRLHYWNNDANPSDEITPYVITTQPLEDGGGKDDFIDILQSKSTFYMNLTKVNIMTNKPTVTPTYMPSNSSSGPSASPSLRPVSIMTSKPSPSPLSALINSPFPSMLPSSDPKAVPNTLSPAVLIKESSLPTRIPLAAPTQNSLSSSIKKDNTNFGGSVSWSVAIAIGVSIVFIVLLIAGCTVYFLCYEKRTPDDCSDNYSYEKERSHQGKNDIILEKSTSISPSDIEQTDLQSYVDEDLVEENIRVIAGPTITDMSALQSAESLEYDNTIFSRYNMLDPNAIHMAVSPIEDFE